MRRYFTMAAGLFGLVACSDGLPVSNVTPPKLSLAVQSSEPTRFAILFKGGTPGGFADRITALGGTVELVHERSGIAIVSGLSPTAAASLATSTGIELVQQDFTYQGVIHAVEPVVEAAAAMDEATAASQVNPATAFFFPRQWHHRAIGANVAWANGVLGSPNVSVAILDTGIDHLYPDLVGLVDVARSISFVPSDDALLAQFFPGAGRPAFSDLNGHGTHVGSTVSSLAIVNAAVTSRTKLIAVKVLGASGSGTFTGILNGILYATDQGADVINMSLGALFARRGNHDFIKLLDRVTKFARDEGVTTVVAAGNEAALLRNGNNELFGAFCSNKKVLCVSATGPNRSTTPNGPYFPSVDESAVYTNFGKHAIDVAAPGGNFAVNPAGQVVSAVPVWAACSKTMLVRNAAGQFVKFICAQFPQFTFTLGFIGTSMASPHAAGLAALLVERVGRDPQRIGSLIEDTGDDLGPQGKDDRFGRGRINVARAVGL
ncbi:MAG: S8 family serine peptidase [Gemmatimonadaceae bacterium]